jgi:prolyl oligopeptidase
MRTVLVLAVAAACARGPRPAVPEPPDPEAEWPNRKMKHDKPWPETRIQDVVETIHDTVVHDPYRWLEEEADPSVQSWMLEQDAYARGVLAKLPGRDDLAARVKELLYYDAIGAPVHRGSRHFYTRKHADREKTVVYWKTGETEHVLLDPNTWSTSGDKTLAGWWPSWDGRFVAYAISEHNSDETVTHVLDVESGHDLPDVIAGTRYSSASWTPDAAGFYYEWTPQASEQVPMADRQGFTEVRFHKLGSDAALDPIIHEATHDPEKSIGGGISRDGHWLVVSIHRGWSRNDVYFKDARKKGAPWMPLVAGIDATFDVTVWRDRFYVTTNDGAPRYRVFVVDPQHAQRESWHEIVKQSDATLQGAQVIGEHLVLTYLRHATSEIAVHDLGGHLVRKLPLPGLGTVAGVTGNPDDDTAYFGFTSFTEPHVIFKTSMRTGKTDEWARVKLPFDGSRFVTEQVFYPSKDGTKVSMFIIRGRDAAKSAVSPTVLYGYGGFNISQVPAFSASRAVWLERGGVYAIPNLRGGGEYGEDWHRAGMLLDKQNVFDDFIAAADYLVSQGYTSKGHLAISGGSNGGLLVGAVMAQRPDLVKAVVCSVPLLDMLRYHLFGLGKTWVPEYGSADDAEQFRALFAYSPYRRIVEAAPLVYPAMLMDSADHDDRVDPMHARKLVAALQAKQTAEMPILLRIERNAGHHGADMVRAQVERAADQLAFLISQLR